MENNLPVKTGEDFVAEFETMDLSDLKDRLYVVAVNNGDRSGPKFVCSTIRGPYTFEEMCEQVGVMWRNHQHHAKVTVLEKNPEKGAKILDENTVDYIEAHYEDIVTESMLGGVFDEIKDYTCRANIIESANEAPINTTAPGELSADQQNTGP